MKTIILFLLIACGFTFTSKAQDVDNSDILLIDEFVNSITSREIEKVVSEDLNKVFTGTFYSVSPVITLENSYCSCGDNLIVIKDGQLIQIEEVGFNKRLEQLFSLLHEDFTIISESDAQTFEKVLDEIYPLSWADKPEEKKFFRRDNTWVFVRGEYFEGKKGFIVELDQASKITGILYDIAAVK